MLGIVGRMHSPIIDDDLWKIERRKPVQASNVDSKLVRIGATLVMRINPADRAVMMLRGHRVETIGRQLVGAFMKFEAIDGA